MILSVVFFILVMLFPMGVMAVMVADGPLDPPQGDNPLDAMEETVQAQIYALPLSFIPNVGQLDPNIAFTVTGRGSTLYFTSNAVVITAREGDKSVVHVIRQTFPGSAESPVIEGEDLLPGVANYFTGNDPSRWQSNVPTYGSVLYRNLYPGIDLRYKGTEGILKREFVVAPGADPAVLRLHYEGVDGISVDDDGALVIITGNSTLTESPVICYQEINGRQVIIPARYHYDGDRDITFAIGTYDPSFPLVIDPALVYSTFLGGREYGDVSNGIAVDSSGNAYVTGNACSSDFPTTVGAYNRTLRGSNDAFVTKLNPSGSSLVYSTYLGGTATDIGYGIAVDSSGNVYVTGLTYSSDFPTTVSAFDRTFGGGNTHDAFVTKLNPSGSSLVYSTYLGGNNGGDTGYSITVDSSGNAYVTGQTYSSDFPTTTGAYNRTHGGGQDVFVTKLNPSGSSLVYSTYLGGNNGDIGRDIAVDSSGNAYVTGQTYSSNFPTTASAYNRTYGGGGRVYYDAFVTKLNPSGSSLVYSTYLGGTADDTGTGIAVDSSGNTYLTGDTSSSNFPTTVSAYNRTNRGSQDVFVTKMNPAGSSLVYSTYLGGTGADTGYGIAVDGSGNAYVTGYTFSSNFPTTDNAYDRIFEGGYTDVFVTKLNPSGSSLVYSTYLGGSGRDSGNGIAVDSIGDVYVTGSTMSSDFPTTTGAFNRTCRGSDAFVAKLPLADLPPAGSRIGVFRNGVWYLDYNGNGIWNGNAIDRQYTFGIPGDIPITGDWNTTGKTSIGYQRYGSSWFLDYNGNGIWNGTAIDRFSIFGLDDTPVAGDWNGNGKSKIGIYRNGVWYLDYNGNGRWDGTVIDRKYSFGTTGDKPVVGQWNGNAISEIGIFRDNETWQLDYNGNGIWNGTTIDRQYTFGIPGDIPISGDWNNDSKSEIGVFRNSTHLFLLDYNGNGVWNGSVVDRQYNFGLSGDQPVTGKW
jgi:hypothetical protein